MASNTHPLLQRNQGCAAVVDSVFQNDWPSMSTDASQVDQHPCQQAQEQLLALAVML